MALFDAAIFDSVIFDTGEAVVVTPTGGAAIRARDGGHGPDRQAHREWERRFAAYHRELEDEDEAVAALQRLH